MWDLTKVHYMDDKRQIQWPWRPFSTTLTVDKKARSSSVGLGQLTEEMADIRGWVPEIQPFYWLFYWQESSFCSTFVWCSLPTVSFNKKFPCQELFPWCIQSSRSWAKSPLDSMCSDTSLLSFHSTNPILHLHCIKVLGSAVCISLGDKGHASLLLWENTSHHLNCKEKRDKLLNIQYIPARMSILERLRYGEMVGWGKGHLDEFLQNTTIAFYWEYAKSSLGII